MISGAADSGGSELSPADLDALQRSGISRELAAQARLRRVESHDGAELVGRNGFKGDYAGIAFPYVWPGEQHPRLHRLRRDRPEMEQRPEGGLREKGKYLGPPGAANAVYFVPGTDAEWLKDASLPVLITEGEKKTLALHALGWHGASDASERPKWMPIGLGGVWSWRGTVGKAPGPDGDRRDVKGVIADMERIKWRGRKVTVVFDRNVTTNESVQAARFTLTSELRKRGADVWWFNWPASTPAEVNGVDDLVGVLGAQAVLMLLKENTSRPRLAGSQRNPVVTVNCRSMEDVMSDNSVRVPELLVDGLVPKGGLVLLGGRPKDGKSWLACQLGLAIVTGDALGGWLQVKERGRVHLWALEDQAAITKDKIGKLLGGSRPAGLRDLLLYEELPRPILAGGDQLIHDALTKDPASLIILDSLFKLTGASGQRNRDIQQADYDVIDRVRKIVIEHGCSAVIVMHTKKGARGGNPIENLIGTSGTTAAADAMAELKRTGVREGRLTVVGRLVQQEDYELSWHCGAETDSGTDSWGWMVEGTGDDALIGETMSEVLAYLEAQGATKPSTIAAALHRTFRSVWNALLRLESRGKVHHGKDKKWELVR